MERASFALATIVARDVARRRSVVGPDGGRRDGRVTGARAVLLVGPGNNGGDTLFAGAHLVRRGMGVLAVLASEHVHGGGLAALRRAGGRVVELVPESGGEGGASRWGDPDPATVEDAVSRAVGADVVLDGLLGIGASGALRGPAAVLVRRLVEVLGARTDRDERGGDGSVRSRPWVVAVDVPSGIGVDDGTLPGTVLRADRTVTFGAAKPGLLVPPAAGAAGHGAVVEIGLALGADPAGPPGPAVRRLEARDVGRLWTVPGPEDQKYTRGVLGVVAGTPTFPGAAVLVTSAAVRTGPGMVRYQGPDDVARAVLAARPEVVPASGRVQAWALGSGVPAAAAGGAGHDEPDPGGQHARIRAALADAAGDPGGATSSGGPVPTVVDAGALSLLPDRCPPWFVLTPHAGELATLLQGRGEAVDRPGVEAEPLRWARRAHELTGATVLLKGSVTLVVGPARVYAQADAPAWLATAGAGDVLTGILGVVLAGHAARAVAEPGSVAELAAAAALVHGLAAERANPGGPISALDVAAAVPGVVCELVAAR